MHGDSTALYQPSVECIKRDDVTNEAWTKVNTFQREAAWEAVA